MPLDEMDEASTSAPLSDRRMERCEPKERTREGHIPEVTHLACLSGLSNSEGQRWEQNKKKKKEGIVLSQAGRARHVAEPSVRSTHRDCFVCATVC